MHFAFFNTDIAFFTFIFIYLCIFILFLSFYESLMIYCIRFCSLPVTRVGQRISQSVELLLDEMLTMRRYVVLVEHSRRRAADCYNPAMQPIRNTFGRQHRRQVRVRGLLLDARRVHQVVDNRRRVADSVVLVLAVIIVHLHRESFLRMVVGDCAVVLDVEKVRDVVPGHSEAVRRITNVRRLPHQHHNLALADSSTRPRSFFESESQIITWQLWHSVNREWGLSKLLMPAGSDTLYLMNIREYCIHILTTHAEKKIYKRILEFVLMCRRRQDSKNISHCTLKNPLFIPRLPIIGQCP